MKTINSFLKRFEKIKVPNDSVRKEFKKIILKRFSFELSFRKIKVQNNKIYFSAPAVLKNEIFLHKKEILEKINKDLNLKIKDLI